MNKMNMNTTNTIYDEKAKIISTTNIKKNPSITNWKRSVNFICDIDSTTDLTL